MICPYEDRVGKQERFGQGGSQKRTPNKKEGETKDSKHEGLQEKVLSASKKVKECVGSGGYPPDPINCECPHVDGGRTGGCRIGWEIGKLISRRFP